MEYNTNCGVYKITNIVNGKFYIGSSKEISKRWGCHRKAKRNMIIHNAIRKYGIENFVFEILECCKEEQLIEREQFYYDLLEPQYNAIRPIENPMENPNIIKRHKNAVNSEEHRKKISEASKKNYHKIKQTLVKSSHTETANQKRISTMTSDEFKASHSETMKRIWADEDFRKENAPKKAEILKQILERADVKEKIAKCSKKRWENEEYREYIISKTIALKKKKVYLHDGKKIHEFESIASCGRWIADIKGVDERNAYVNVSQALNSRGNRTKSAYGYNVSFESDVKPYEKQTKRVVALNEKLEVIKVFEDAQNASEFFGCHKSTIRKACVGIVNKTQGYKWMYLEEYEKLKSAN